MYLHIDLDVHEPADAQANQYAVPGGLSPSTVRDLVRVVAERFEIAAAALTAYDPTFDAEDECWTSDWSSSRIGAMRIDREAGSGSRERSRSGLQPGRGGLAAGSAAAGAPAPARPPAAGTAAARSSQLRSAVSVFTELRAHTGFSFGDGAVTPEALVARAIALGYTALGLTDTADLGGIPRFVHAAQRRRRAAADRRRRARVDGRPAAFLVRTPEGYRNLAALVTRARMGDLGELDARSTARSGAAGLT